ncbi:hypothetical protein RJT34_24767 [Clitoria ternatea]|uniref:non-specific serine/threonine protein kinase n=1 Tax=Clitoria ternatea TaxID=43366 RepID=A0AAN9FNU0_CLITE
MDTQDFTFPKINDTYPCSSIDSPSLWNTSQKGYSNTNQVQTEGSKGDGKEFLEAKLASKDQRKSLSCVQNRKKIKGVDDYDEEVPMDLLWEVFNEELSSATKFPNATSSSSREVVEIKCATSLTVSKTSTALLHIKNRPGIVMIIKILKKLFSLNPSQASDNEGEQVSGVAAMQEEEVLERERMGTRSVGKYELGRTLGEGNFSKVKYARNTETGDKVAIKILDKDKLVKHHMIPQVMASKTKIYIVLELVTGGELFDKIANHGRLKEDEARQIFQQLICAVDYCHSRGVFHRDLKLENLLLDANGVLKVSDFGFSALPQQIRGDGLLHTKCGTPNYVAPEVIHNKGYEGAKADIWSCGVILFVLLAGYLPFEDDNLMTLYKKIFKAEFTCPAWFSTNSSLHLIELVNITSSDVMKQRITINEVIENEWFKKGYQPRFSMENGSLDDVNAIFSDANDSQNLVERQEDTRVAPVTMNVFELMLTSQGFNLGNLFEKQMGLVKKETRWTSKCSANEIISKIEQAAQPLGFNIKRDNYKLKIQGEKTGRKGHLSIVTEIFEVVPSLNMIKLRKSGGDTLEFHKFYKNLSTRLEDIIWKAEPIDKEIDELYATPFSIESSEGFKLLVKHIMDVEVTMAGVAEVRARS